jgi:hypothetical protein
MRRVARVHARQRPAACAAANPHLRHRCSCATPFSPCGSAWRGRPCLFQRRRSAGGTEQRSAFDQLEAWCPCELPARGGASGSAHPAVTGSWAVPRQPRAARHSLLSDLRWFTCCPGTAVVCSCALPSGRRPGPGSQPCTSRSPDPAHGASDRVVSSAGGGGWRARNDLAGARAKLENPFLARRVARCTPTVGRDPMQRAHWLQGRRCRRGVSGGGGARAPSAL